jgi:hypothetical protein
VGPRVKGMAGGLLLLVLGGCSRADSVSLTNADSGREIRIGVEGRIEITLQTIGPGEYSEPDVSSGSVRLTDIQTLMSPPAGPKQRFRFEASASGRASITIPHTGQNPAFSLLVEVE